jgi:MFS family permease
LGRAYKYYVLAILLVVYAYNFLERQILSISMESIKVDLTLSDTQLGVLTGLSFAIFHAIAGIPIARWADRGNRTHIISLALGVLSVTVALCSAVGSFAHLLLARIGVGLGEAGVVPPAHSLVASYFDRPERLHAMSIFLLGGPLSMAVGYLLGGWSTEFFGWRMTFLMLALPGVILTVLMRFSVREPRQWRKQAFSQTQESQEDVQGLAKASTRQILDTLWGQHTFRHLLLAIAGESLFGWAIVQWLPVFFIRSHAMSTGELGTWMAINWGVGNAVGIFAGGYLTSRAIVHAERRQLRVMSLIACLYVPITVAVLLLSDKHIALSVMFVGALLVAIATAPTYTLIQSLVPENMRATAVAAVFLVNNLIGLALGPLVVGMLSDSFSLQYGANSLRLALLACAPGYGWVAFHYYKASRTVMADLSKRGTMVDSLAWDRPRTTTAGPLGLRTPDP